MNSINIQPINHRNLWSIAEIPLVELFHNEYALHRILGRVMYLEKIHCIPRRTHCVSRGTIIVQVQFVYTYFNCRKRNVFKLPKIRLNLKKK